MTTGLEFYQAVRPCGCEWPDGFWPDADTGWWRPGGTDDRVVMDDRVLIPCGDDQVAIPGKP